MTLTDRVQFHSMFSFKYSERPNTLARQRMPDSVTASEKARRLERLQALQRRTQLRLHERLVGEQVQVLAEAKSRRRAAEYCGRTSGNAVVNFPADADCIGSMVDVRVERAGPHSVWGMPVTG